MQCVLFLLISILILLWAASSVREGLHEDPVFDSVYYINLDKRPHRRSQIGTQVARLKGLVRETIRVSAVDGSRLSGIDPQVVSFQGRADLRNPSKKFGLTLTRGAVGCAMTHKSIWEDVATTKKDLVLILEDDAVILPDFRKKISSIISELPATWDILYLGSGGGGGRGDPAPLTLRNSGKKSISPHLAQPSSRIYGLFGYAINWRGAERLLKRVFPLRYQIDTELWMNFSDLQPLISAPFIIAEKKGKSDIQIK